MGESACWLDAICERCGAPAAPLDARGWCGACVRATSEQRRPRRG